MLTSRQLAIGRRGRKIRKSAPRQYYVLTCGAVSAVSVYGAVRTLLDAPRVEPTLFQVIATAGVLLAVGWLCLLIVQTVLVQLGRTFYHKRLGQIGAAIGFGAPIAAVVGAVLRAREQAGLAPAIYGQAEVAMVVHMANGLAFLTFLGLALYRREVPDFHRRWILLAMLALVPEAVMGPDPSGAELMAIYSVLDGLLLVTAGRDILRLGRVHRVYRMSLTPLVLLQSLTLIVYVKRWPILLMMIDSLISGRI